MRRAARESRLPRSAFHALSTHLHRHTAAAALAASALASPEAQAEPVANFPASDMVDMCTGQGSGSNRFVVHDGQLSMVPEPATAALLLGGPAAIGLRACRRSTENT